MEINGRVALVTGAARRVGREITLALVQAGASGVMVHYHGSEEPARQTVEAVRQAGAHAAMVQADFSSEADIARMFDTYAQEFGRLDLLINSASAFQPRDFMALTVEDWDYTMGVNLRAPFLCSQHAARIMQAQGTGGVIINIGDIAGVVPWKRFPHHSVSKAGLMMLTKVIAKSLGPDIRANLVIPGPVLKPDEMPVERWEQLGAELPLRRTGAPRNVAQAVVALIENDFITGSVLHVDGGDALVGSID